MKLGVLGDVHAEDLCLAAALAFMRGLSVDAILCVGDIVDGAGDLPATRSIETPRGKLLLCHGLALNDMRRLGPQDDGYELECNDELQGLLASKEFAFVVGGHTHQRMVRRFGAVTVLNAGTLKRRNDPCFCVLDLAANQADFYDISNHEAPLFVDAFEIPARSS